MVAPIDIDTARVAAEYEAMMRGCGLLDRSERGKLALSGPDAKALLTGQVTNDIEALRPGRGCYAALLNHKGKMLADLRVLDVDEELLLDTERTALQALFDALRRAQIGYDAHLHKRTLERGMLSLIGPHSASIAGLRDLGETEHANAPATIDGIRALAVRTDLGVDLICDAPDTPALRDRLRARGATPVSERAADILRVERGRPRYGVDMDDSTIPQEANLNERAVSFTKGCYTGQETVARLHYRGKPNRHLRGLRLSAPAAPGAELRLGERPVGRLTSAVLSPAHGPIGLALVRREALPGALLSVGEEGPTAEVVELPFGADGTPSGASVTPIGANTRPTGADVTPIGHRPPGRRSRRARRDPTRRRPPQPSFTPDDNGAA